MSWQVPAYQTHEFFPRRTRFCLCIPVLDEEGAIGPVLTAYPDVPEFSEYL